MEWVNQIRWLIRQIEPEIVLGKQEHLPGDGDGIDIGNGGAYP